MDGDPGPDRRSCSSLTDRADDPRDPERAQAARRARGHRHRAPVVVGVPLSRARDRHGERAARAGQRPGEPDADVPQAALRRRGPQLLGPAPGRQDRPHSEPREPDVDRSRTSPGSTSGSAREYCGTQHAKMLLRVYVHTPRGIRSLGQRAAAQPATQVASRCRGPARLRDHGLHQLPRGRRHGGNGTLRSRPHAPDEPRDARVRRRAEHAREPAALDSRIRTPFKPGSLMPAMQLTDARAGRARGLSRDAAMSVEAEGRWRARDG